MYEEEEDIDHRVFALVSHLARALNMSVSSIKGYFERDIGQVILKGNGALRQLRQLRAIGSSATSVAIFPLDRLEYALASAKGPNKDLVKRIAALHMEETSDEVEEGLNNEDDGLEADHDEGVGLEGGDDDDDDHDHDDHGFGYDDGFGDDRGFEDEEHDGQEVDAYNLDQRVQSVLATPKILTLEEVGTTYQLHKPYKLLTKT